MASTVAISRRREATADALAGVVASLVSLWTFYPVDVLKTNLQAGTLPKQWSLFRGIHIKSAHTVSSSFAYFYIYSWIVSWWRAKSGRSKLIPLHRLALSAIAAVLNTSLTLPLDVLAAQRQTTTPSKTLNDHDSTETMEENEEEDDDDDEVFFDSNEEEDEHTVVSPLDRMGTSSEFHLCSLWKGLWPSLLLCSNPSINYTVFDVLKSRTLLARGRQKLSMLEAFCLGLIAKLCATLATYPLIRAKVMLMVTSSNKSLWSCLLSEYKRDGVQGLYRGCNLQLLHTILKSALMMMVRERITATAHTLLVPHNQERT